MKNLDWDIGLSSSLSVENFRKLIEANLADGHFDRAALTASLQAYTVGCMERWRTWAAQNDVEYLRLLRNATAICPNDRLPFLVLLLISAANAGVGEIEAPAKAIVEMLHAELLVHPRTRFLLDPNQPITPRDLRYCAGSLEDNPEMYWYDESDPIRSVEDAVGRMSHYVDARRTESISLAHEYLSKFVERKPLRRLSLERLARMSPRLRKLAMHEGKYIDLFFTREAARRIRRHPFLHSDSYQSRVLAETLAGKPSVELGKAISALRTESGSPAAFMDSVLDALNDRVWRERGCASFLFDHLDADEYRAFLPHLTPEEIKAILGKEPGTAVLDALWEARDEPWMPAVFRASQSALAGYFMLRSPDFGQSMSNHLWIMDHLELRDIRRFLPASLAETAQQPPPTILVDAAAERPSRILGDAYKLALFCSHRDALEFVLFSTESGMVTMARLLNDLLARIPKMPWENRSASRRNVNDLSGHLADIVAGLATLSPGLPFSLLHRHSLIRCVVAAFHTQLRGSKLEAIVNAVMDEGGGVQERPIILDLPVQPSIAAALSMADGYLPALERLLAAKPESASHIARLLAKSPREFSASVKIEPILRLLVDDGHIGFLSRTHSLWARKHLGLAGKAGRDYARLPSGAPHPLLDACHEISGHIGSNWFRVLSAFALRMQDGRFTSGSMFRDMYHVFQIPKKNGKMRTISAPDDLLKHLQRALLDHGFFALRPHPAAVGFLPGLSILDNASRHERKRIVVTADIKDFFPSTKFAAVHRVCHHLWDGKISPFAARFVAEICCNDGGLPIGSPASPAIANMVMLPADLALDKAATKWGISYSRFADDLCFSSLDEAAPKILPFVGKVLGECGYRLAQGKTNIARAGRRQTVTGLVVNKKASLSRDRRRTLRAMVDHKARGLPVHDHGQILNVMRFNGRLSSLKLSRPAEYAALRSRLRGGKP